ncbi:uncharacterized protein METZ01_LOCUS120122 [marine metagenome]|uniref:Uncharacterized protein n=1 Tax=marine metagenome TaxID=408172 RepID=A0A381XRB6_9ZZZZ
MNGTSTPHNAFQAILVNWSEEMFVTPRFHDEVPIPGKHQAHRA